MASQSKLTITDKDIAGLKYFEKLWLLFERLHERGAGIKLFVVADLI